MGFDFGFCCIDLFLLEIFLKLFEFRYAPELDHAVVCLIDVTEKSPA